VVELDHPVAARHGPDDQAAMARYEKTSTEAES
jgi:hypothetical protein